MKSTEHEPKAYIWLDMDHTRYESDLDVALTGLDIRHGLDMDLAGRGSGLAVSGHVNTNSVFMRHHFLFLNLF